MILQPLNKKSEVLEMGILAVVLGILGILVAFLGTFLFGTVGGIAAGVLAVIAIGLGFLKRKNSGKGGIAAIVIGVLAIVLAFSMTNSWSKVFSNLHTKALEYKPDGLWAQVSEDTNGGLMGIINKIPQDEASMNALVDEMNELNKITEK